MLIGIDAHNLEGKRTGVGRYLFNLLREWHSAGNPTVKFILYFKKEIPADLPKSDLFECRLLNVGSTAKFMHWDLSRAAKKDRVDVLFCPDYRGPFMYKGDIAVTLHDISYEAHPEWFNWPSVADRILLRWASKQTAGKAKIIFVPVEFVKNEVIKYYGVTPERIFATPLSADPALLELPANLNEEIAKIKAKYGVRDKFAFYVGSVFSRRHLPEIIAAFELLAKEGDYQLVLGGKDYTNGKSVDKLAKKINEKLGRQAIVRVDFIVDDELKLLYSACAFFIWLSDYEGFGLPPLEAMNLGAPVITTDGSSLSEVAGQAALLIKDNFDVEEIFRAMHKITRDGVLREEMIARGREQAARFSWKNCAERTLKTLLSLSK